MGIVNVSARINNVLGLNLIPRKLEKSKVMDYDRMAEVKLFDDSKIGVKGLVDSGITNIPRFFVHKNTSEVLTDHNISAESIQIPVIDLLDVHSHRRNEIINHVSKAACEWGFFQVLNHGISLPVLDATISAIKSFHEQPVENKRYYYCREKPVRYVANNDLLRSTAASWRDTLLVKLAPEPPEMEQIPAICRKEVLEWGDHATRLADMLMELLCEGLGMEAKKLKEMKCSADKILLGQYYPYCPQPDLTMGIPLHTDKGVLTVLLQDQIGGLQIKKGEQWVAVKPLPGALVINVGDLLQILCNDEYKSGEHRVLANPLQEPRTSIAVFVSLDENSTSSYGPLEELLSPAKPPLYRNFTMSEIKEIFLSKELVKISLPNEFRLLEKQE